jgi:hypothetical protein
MNWLDCRCDASSVPPSFRAASFSILRTHKQPTARIWGHVHPQLILSSSLVSNGGGR